jgi:putative ABC transport system permease protein
MSYLSNLNPDIFHNNLAHLAAMATLFSGFTLALLLAFAKKEGQRTSLFLSAAIIAIVLKTGGISAIFLPALGPLLYFYVQQLTFPNLKFHRKDLLHFCPLLVAYRVPGWLVLLSVVIYLWLSHRLIQQFYNRLRPVLMDRPRFAFRRLNKALHLLSLLCVAWIFNDALSFIVAFVLIGMAAEVMLKLESSTQMAVPLTDRYDAKEKSRRLKEAVTANRFYEDAELTLTTLAIKLNIHPHDLSRIINVGMGKNFSDFINEFRVRETARKMRDPLNANLTLLGIAFESGFNSQRTFNRVFKEMTGKTPVEYKNGLKKELPIDKLANPSHSAPVILRSGSPPNWAPVKLNRNYMIKNYLKTALRGFWRHKLFTVINIAGLSIGISASVVIYLIVNYDFTFDKFHKDNDRICRVVMDVDLSNGQKIHESGMPGPLAGAIKSQATGIEAVVPLRELSPHFVYIKNEQKRFKDPDKITFSGQQYFKVFNYVWLAGSQQHALDQPNQVVLTSQQAQLYFPLLQYKDMIGKIVTYDTLKTTVSGIVQTPTQNTDFAFHDFVSISTITASKRLATDIHIEDWNRISSGSEVFLKLLPGASASEVAKQINAISKANNPPRPDQPVLANRVNLRLQALDDIHFNTDYNIFDFSSQASKTADYGLLAIAGFLLLLACINFVNLTTAQAGQRAKEIGIRKTLGGSRMQLIVQFLSETFLITFFAVAISVLLAPVILGMFADFISPDIHMNFLHQPEIILFLLILTIVVTVLSGFYPALMLSGYKPVSVLKNQTQNDSNKTRNAWLRKSLTVSQFVVAQFFIMATVLVSRQIYYVLHKDLGFKKDAILVVDSPWSTATTGGNKVLLNSFQSIPGVTMVSLGSDPPSSDGFNRTRSLYSDGKKQIITEEVVVKSGDENYIKTYQLKLLAGRNILESDTGKAIIINTTYARMLGFTNPHDAIGKQLGMIFGRRNISIIGVVADFNERSLHSPIYPLAIHWGSEKYREMKTLHISLKPETAGGNEWKTAIARMGKAWKTVYPDDDFDYHFYDDIIARFYEEEQHTSTLLTWATGLSIFISCIGLLGLAIYTTNQRAKEIGIRKVLGATVTQIVTLLSTELVWLILLAFIIVTPIAWYAVNKWMEGFVDHVAISWWIFIICGAGMLITALFTLSFQTVRAAIANPVKSLRSE